MTIATASPIQIPELPYVKWAGGKREQIPRLREFWGSEKHRRLVDLTVGAGAIPLGLKPERALLNDINPHVINLHQWVQRGLDMRDFEFINTQKGYLERRDRFNLLISTEQHQTREAAQLFYYLLKSCFNGLCRFSRNGFNVGWGKYKTTPDRYRLDFRDYQAAFKGWEFTSLDFAEVPLQSDDFVVVDPPYDSQDAPEQMSLLGVEHAGQSGKGFTSYNINGFSWADQVRLAKHLAQHPGPAIAFNAATPRILDLYGSLGFQVQTYEKRHVISCKGSKRAVVQEMLAFKPAAPQLIGISNESTLKPLAQSTEPEEKLTYVQQRERSQQKIEELKRWIAACEEAIALGHDVDENEELVAEYREAIEDEEYEFPHYFQPGDRVRVKTTVASSDLHGKFGVVQSIRYEDRNAKNRPIVEVYFHPTKQRELGENDSLRFDPVSLELIAPNPYRVGDTIVQDLNNPYWRKQGHIIESSVSTGTILEYRPTYGFSESQYPWVRWDDGTEDLGIITCFRSMRNGKLIEFEDEIADILKVTKEPKPKKQKEKTISVKSPEPITLPERFAPRQTVSFRLGTKAQLIHAAVNSRHGDLFSKGLAEADLWTIEQAIASPEVKQQGKTKMKKLEKRRAELLKTAEHYEVQSDDWTGVLTQDHDHGIHLRFIAPYGSEWHHHVIDSESITEVVQYFHERLSRDRSGEELFVGSKDADIMVWLHGKPSASDHGIHPQEGDRVRLYADCLPQTIEWERRTIRGFVGERVVAWLVGPDDISMQKVGAIAEIQHDDTILVRFDYYIEGYGDHPTLPLDRSMLARCLTYGEITEASVFDVVEVNNLGIRIRFEGSDDIRISAIAIKEIVQSD